MLRLSLSQGRAHTHICPDRIAFSQVDRHVHTLLRSSIYSAAYVSQRLYSTRRRRRAVETWLKDVPEHRKEALEFERLLGLRKGIKHKDAPLLNVEESKNLMEIRAKGNERNMRKLEKFKKLAPRQQTKALWYSANKAPLIRQKVVAKQLQDKMDVFGFDPDSKEGKQRMRALNAEEDLRTLGPQSAPLLSSGEVHVQSPPHTSSTLQISRGAEPQDYLAAHTHTRPQAPASGTGSDGAGYNNSPQGRVRRERQEKVWIGDSYDAELDIDLANLEPMPVLSKQEIRNRLKGNSTEHDQHADTSDYASLSATHRDIERKRQERDLKPTYVTVQSKERGVVPPERGSKRMRKIRKYLDPEEAFFNPDLAYKKAKKKADKAATRWKNRGISWAQINANLPPGVEPGPRKPKGWDRKEPPKAMKSEWEPTKRLSRPAMEKVRKLREENRSTWTTVALADRFKVSPEAIHRILRSKWQPSAEQYQRQMTRTFADYELHRQTRHRIAETDHE